MLEEPKNYKETLLLPKTNFPMRAGLPVREPDWLDHWEKLNVYHRLRKKAGKRKPFILHDGPPYANGNLHIGHALNKILKDFITRSQQMLGKDARYVPGWDCHGLPIEWKIEEKYRAKGLNKDDVPINDLRNECRKFAKDWVDIQSKEFRRLGIIGDWEHPYLTMDFSSEAVIAEEFMKFMMNGSLYQGSKPVMWSPVEKTALAEAEIEYREHRSPTIWVKFMIPSGDLKGAQVVIWTTTPWTIPSNKAVAYNFSISYGLYKVLKTEEECWAEVGELLIFADNLADDCLKEARVTDHERLRSVDHDDLKDLNLQHPFYGMAGAMKFWDYDVPMINGGHVTEDAGTGFVHTAPSHGADDYEAFVNLGWTGRMTHNIGEDSSFNQKVPFFAGLQVFNPKGKEGKANNSVINKLIESGSLLARGRLTHSYPHSWRSKAPVIFRNTPQWFVAIDKDLTDGMDEFGKSIRSRALSSIDQLVQWTPKAGRNRLFSMISTRPDWVLSRQRAWGVPLTCFVKKGLVPTDNEFILRDAKVNARIAEVFNLEGADAWFEKGAKERFLGDLYNSEDYEQILDILDVWFDSGSTHAFVLRDRNKENWPADLYLEGTDQHRGWFHSSMLQSCGTRGHAPYKGVLTHGFTLDEKGMKMSKSQGNAVSPDQVIKQYGADILRLWVAQSDYTSDLRIGTEILKGVSDSYRRLRNTFRFLLGSLVDFDKNLETVNYSELPELEKWILHRLSELDSVVKDGYEAYAFQSVFQQIFQFCTVDLSSLYFDIRKDCLYCDSPKSELRRSTRTVLDLIFFRLTSWLAPILVFTTEEVWLERFGGSDTSIHMEDIPDTPKDWLNLDLSEKWTAIRKVRKVVTGAIEVHRQNKTIGSSLESSPEVYVSNSNLFDQIASINFAEICITSDLKLHLGSITEEMFSLEDVDGVGVIFSSAEGKKCARCWKFVENLSDENGCDDICCRCSDTLNLN